MVLVPTLLIMAGPLEGERLTLVPGDELVLGREKADVVIDDSQVSRRHAVIRAAGGGLEVEDLGSLNGTFVNRQRIERATPLKPGDVIGLGESSIEVEAPHVVAQPTVASARPAGTEFASLPRPEPARRDEDELRRVTALFADVVGSTRLGERLRPDEVKTLIGECVTQMTRAVEQFGGTVQSYMGDGIAAFFGMPVAHEDDPERAARAALRILEVVGDYARDIETTWGISDFSVRVGINSGQTAVGRVGAADPRAVALGDTTNVAARLEGVAEPGTIVVGEGTAGHLAQFALEPLGEVSVKGRVDPVRAFRLVGAQTSVPTPAQAPLVNRETEVAHLRSAVEELRSGRGQILLLAGEAGIGKTRLLGTLAELAADGAIWLEGNCLSYGQEALLRPFVEILRGWLGVEEAEPELAVRMKMQAKLGALLGPRADLLDPLGRLLSVRGDASGEPGLEVEIPGAAVRHAYHAWIDALSQHRAVVVAVEDLHWSDQFTRELAEDLLELTERAPVLLAATFRPDSASEAWRFRTKVLSDYAHRTSELTVGPLNEAASEELLGQLFPGELDPVARRGIVLRAEGNPLYLEELMRTLVEGGGLERKQRTWGLTASSSMLLPPALENLLVARIDRLPDSARRLAQVAAIIGRSFPVRVLERVAEGEDVHQDLTVLLRAEIIRELRRQPEFECTFKHGLLHEAALSTLTLWRRQELYRRVAAAFELLFVDPPDDYLERLAHYYARSDDLAKALEYLERAGARAAELDAGARARELWMRATQVAARLGDTSAGQRIARRVAQLGETAESPTN